MGSTIAGARSPVPDPEPIASLSPRRTHGLASPGRREQIRLVEGQVELDVALLASFRLGLVVERLSGVETGHAELLGSIQDWLDTLESSRG